MIMEFLLQHSLYLYVMTGLFVTGMLVWAFIPSAQESVFDKRIKRVSGARQKTAMLSKNQIDIRLDKPGTRFDEIIKRIIPKPDLLKDRLARTGYKITVTHYGLMVLLVGVIEAVAVNLRLGVNIWICLALGLVAGLKTVDFIINFIINRRKNKFIKNFADAIDLMVRGIKSGLPITQSIMSISHEIDGPVGEEFGKVADAVRLGTDLSDALWDRAKKLDIPEMKFFCIALSIQRETGGNLSETLGNLATILRKRKQMQLKIKAMSSEAKASAIIIGSLPFVMYLILKLMNPEYVEILMNDPRGIKLVFLGLGMIGFGAFVMSKMVRFEI